MANCDPDCAQLALLRKETREDVKEIREAVTSINDKLDDIKDAISKEAQLRNDQIKEESDKRNEQIKAESDARHNEIKRYIFYLGVLMASTFGVTGTIAFVL